MKVAILQESHHKFKKGILAVLPTKIWAISFNYKYNLDLDDKELQ